MRTVKQIHLIIERQDNPDSKPYEEEFMVPYRPNMNVISALMSIRKNPINKNGEKRPLSSGKCPAWKRYVGFVPW